ncbi:neural cell adhesion molecule L1.1-like isoform X2 [Betta splendens]|uniref:Neural cell adhesion molecule L1 n=1 Tax=Betta splendens TaxID=158456 RepID=A0A6P7N1A6_BETSP|nr:neural cell adhesion molecule L1.1-like isoform X2 [Betta splendens]
MCVSQHWRMGSPALPLLLVLLLSLLSSTPPFAQGAISIPKDYKVHNMLQPPVFKETPTSHTAFFREDFHLPCNAHGKPAPTYRWVKDGSLVESEHTGSGTLQAKEKEPLELYQGSYRCYASNTLGTAITQAVKVIVETQPVLLKQKRISKTAYEGESVVLSCNPPQSSTPPDIHWMDKRMDHIKESDRVMVGLDGKLYFANLVTNDSKADYICNAQYSEARTILPDTVVSLRVVPSNDVVHGKPPHLLHPSGSHTAVLALRGQSVTLECIPKGLPTPSVEWKKKDGSLAETGGRPERYGRRLLFGNVTQGDDGEYECRAFNSHGSITHSFTVSVEAAPYWVKEPQNLLYSPGETVRLECQAEGIPTPTVTWGINGQLLSEVDADPRRSVSGGVLILKDVEFADTAVYQCEASNKHGSILLNTHLYVAALPPQILTSDALVYRVIEGGSVKLQCESFGSPRPHITWESESLDSVLSDPRISLLTNGTIELSEVTHEDSGQYTCSVKHSNISIVAHLEVFNRTVILKGPENVFVVSGSPALLDCHFHKDHHLHSYQVVWKKDGHKLQESPRDKYTVFDNGTLKVTQTQPDDTASYSCEVITDLDHVEAVGSITVAAKPEAPRSLALSEVRDHSLTLSWTPGDSNNSPITEFIVEALEEHHAEEGRWRWKEWKTVPGDFTHLQLTLHPFCSYSFQVIAVNELGRSVPSVSSERYSTPPAVPNHNPTGVRTVSTDPNTLSITWNEMNASSHNGHGFKYKVLWRKAGQPNAQWNQGFAKSPPFFVNDTGTFTPFEIKVQAVNSVGEGPEADPEVGHSGEDKPEEAPTGVETKVTNNTVRVQWNEARNVRGLLLGYKIYIRRLGSQGERLRRSLGKHHHKEEHRERLERGKDRHRGLREVVVSGKDTWVEVTDLKFYSQYELVVTAFNSKGEGPASPEHRFSTPEGAPGPPASLTFDSPTEKTLTLYWSLPLETNGVLLGYVVQYQQELQSKDGLLQIISIDDPSVTHTTLEHLDPSTYYTFQVIARTAEGNGPPATLRGATLLDGVPPSNITIDPSNTSFNLSWVPEERYRNHGFHIRYLRKNAGGEWQESELVNSTQGSYLLTGLQPGSQYRLVVMHGNATQWEGVAWTREPTPSEMTNRFSTQGWLIGLISAILLLVLILLILCLIKRSKGGKYAVKNKEDKEVDSEVRPMKDETFGEYSDGDEKRSDSQPSLCPDSKLGSDDSLAEYGDSVDIQFNEDGSFIGQYSGRAPVPQGNESSGPTSPVSAAPPPPMAPSMSSVLNRPS